MNLIPLSAVPEYKGQPSAPKTAEMFVGTLKRHGINATRRASRGGAVRAACGQLRAGSKNSERGVRNAELKT